MPNEDPREMLKDFPALAMALPHWERAMRGCFHFEMHVRLLAGKFFPADSVRKGVGAHKDGLLTLLFRAPELHFTEDEEAFLPNCNRLRNKLIHCEPDAVGKLVQELVPEFRPANKIQQFQFSRDATGADIQDAIVKRTGAVNVVDTASRDHGFLGWMLQAAQDGTFDLAARILEHGIGIISAKAREPQQSGNILFKGMVIGGMVGRSSFDATVGWVRGDSNTPLGARVVAEIWNDNVTVTVPVGEECSVVSWPELLDLRNLVKRVVQGFLDLQGTIHGAACLLVLTTVQTPASAPRPLTPDFVVPALPRTTADCLFAVVGGIRPPAPDPRADFLRHALADLRRAVLEPDDSAAFSFRAVEAVRQVFVEPSSDRDSRKSWVGLQTALRCEKTWIDPLREIATPQRHGDRRRFCSGEERTMFFERARELAGRLAVFLANGTLDDAQFPLLK